MALVDRIAVNDGHAIHDLLRGLLLYHKVGIGSKHYFPMTVEVLRLLFEMSPQEREFELYNWTVNLKAKSRKAIPLDLCLERHIRPLRAALKTPNPSEELLQTVALSGELCRQNSKQLESLAETKKQTTRHKERNISRDIDLIAKHAREKWFVVEPRHRIEKVLKSGKKKKVKLEFLLSSKEAEESVKTVLSGGKKKTSAVPPFVNVEEDKEMDRLEVFGGGSDHSDLQVQFNVEGDSESDDHDEEEEESDADEEFDRAEKELMEEMTGPGVVRGDFSYSSEGSSEDLFE